MFVSIGSLVSGAVRVHFSPWTEKDCEAPASVRVVQGVQVNFKSIRSKGTLGRTDPNRVLDLGRLDRPKKIIFFLALLSCTFWRCAHRGVIACVIRRNSDVAAS